MYEFGSQYVNISNYVAGLHYDICIEPESVFAILRTFCVLQFSASLYVHSIKQIQMSIDMEKLAKHNLIVLWCQLTPQFGSDAICQLESIGQCLLKTITLSWKCCQIFS